MTEENKNTDNSNSTQPEPTTDNSKPIVIKEKVVAKVPEPEPLVEPVVIVPEQKRAYNKDPSKKYGRPKKEEKKTVSKIVEKIKKPESKKEEKKLEPVKKKMPSMFWLGITFGVIAGGIGIALLIRKIKELRQTDKEVNALKYIYNELNTNAPEIQNAQFVSEVQQ